MLLTAQSDYNQAQLKQPLLQCAHAHRMYITNPIYNWEADPFIMLCSKICHRWEWYRLSVWDWWLHVLAITCHCECMGCYICASILWT